MSFLYFINQGLQRVMSCLKEPFLLSSIKCEVHTNVFNSFSCFLCTLLVCSFNLVDSLFLAKLPISQTPLQYLLLFLSVNLDESSEHGHRQTEFCSAFKFLPLNKLVHCLWTKPQFKFSGNWTRCQNIHWMASSQVPDRGLDHLWNPRSTTLLFTCLLVVCFSQKPSPMAF